MADKPFDIMHRPHTCLDETANVVNGKWLCACPGGPYFTERDAAVTDFEVHAGGTGSKLNLVDIQAAEIERLRGLVKLGERVVDDFMPNIGVCAIQDIGAVNEFLIEARTVPDPEPGK